MATAAKTLTQIAKRGDLKNGTMKAFQAGGKDVLLAMIGDRYYAAARYCPHMGGDLSQGFVTGTIITCPRHASKFDLTDGRVVRWTDWTGIKASVSKMFKPPRPLHIYAVKVQGDNILVEI